MTAKAKESHEVLKLREKLAERLTKEASKTSPDALESVRETLKGYLANKSVQPARVPLKKRNIVVLGGKQAEAVHSKYVKNLMKRLNAEQPK